MGDWYNRNNVFLSDMDYNFGKIATDYLDSNTHISLVWNKLLKQNMYVVWFWACTGIDYLPYQVSEHDNYEEAVEAMIAFNKKICADFPLILHNSDYTEVRNKHGNR